VGRVDKDRVVKVADFGLARFIEEKEYYRPIDRTRALPVKWMAPESMTEEIFTTKTDVVGNIQGGPKHSAHFCTPYNFVKY